MTTTDKTALNTRQLLTFGIILYFTFIGGSFYSDFNLPLHMFNQALVTALLGGWLIIKLRRGEPFPRTALDGPMLAWLAAHVGAALLGLSPRFSLEKLWIPLTYTLAFYMLVDLHRKGQTVIVARGLYMSAGVVCLVGLVEFASWYFGLPLLSQSAQSWPAIGGLQHPLPPTLYRLNFTLNGATPLSAYLALLIPPALGILITTRNHDDRQAIAAWLVLALIVEGLSQSRGGVLALCVSLPLTGLGWWITRQRSRQISVWRPGLRVARRPALVVALAVGLLLAILVGPTWLERTFNRSGSTQFRVTLWKVALTSFREHPLTGAGPYNFGRSLLRRNDPALPRLQIMTAHNVYLNTAAELGAIGLAAGGWLLLTAGRAWVTRWRGTTDVPAQVQVAAAGAALAGLAVQSLVDTFAAAPNVLPILALAAFTLTDSVEGRQRSVPARTTRPRLKPLTALALFALMLYALGLAWLDVGQLHFQRSVNLAKQGSLTSAIVAAEWAHQIDPAMSLYTFQLAYLQGQMTDRPDALAKAAVLYQAGLAAEPVEGRQTANLAAVLWQTGNHTAAIDAMARATSASFDPVWIVNLGYFYQQIGNMEQAIEAYGQALAISPSLAGSEFWQAEAERAAHFSDILDQAEEWLMTKGEDLTRWRLQIALAREDWPTVVEQAQIMLQDTPGDCEALSGFAQARFQAGMIDEAARLAQEAIDAYRACGYAYLVRGLVNQATGDLAAAKRDWHTALFLDQREAAYYLGQLYEAQGDASAADRFYLSALSLSAVPTDVEITLYDRRATFDLLPPLFRIGVSPEQGESWLALGRLREAQGDLEAARQVYRVLLLEDPYLIEAQERLDALPAEQ